MDTPARLLRLLALLTTRGSWQAGELSERLEITERTIRRDITRLRDLGYAVEAVTGPYGCYSLGAGACLRAAIQHPDVVRRLVVVAFPFRRDGWFPEVRAAPRWG